MRESLREASAAGLNVLRTFAHSTDPEFPFQVGLQCDNSVHPYSSLLSWRKGLETCIEGDWTCVQQVWDDRQLMCIQEKPGSFNEPVFRAMDWLLDEARQQGLRVILSFVDNWKYPGGVDQYVDWSRTAPPRTQERAPDTEGDAEFVVRLAAQTPPT